MWLVFGVLFLGAQSYQYVPLVDSTYKTWMSRSICDIGPFHFSHASSFAMHGDTVFSGYAYKKVYIHDIDYYFALLETSDKKVYYRSSGSTSDSLGSPIYDFSLAVSDSFQHYTIQNIDTIMIGDSTLRRRFFVSNGDVWVEGIGSTKYALIPVSVCGLQGALCWVKQDSILIYSDNNSYCAILAVDDQIDNSIVSVYPNPVVDDIHVSYSSDVLTDDARFYLYDITGKEIFNVSLHKNITAMSAAGLQSGLYVWQVANNKGLVKQGKLLRE